MMDANDLESAINSAKNSEEESNKIESSKMSPEQEIGFHKGALNTLVAERTELIKIIGNIEGIMQAHIKRLKNLGIEIK